MLVLSLQRKLIDTVHCWVAPLQAISCTYVYFIFFVATGNVICKILTMHNVTENGLLINVLCKISMGKKKGVKIY